MKRKQWELLEFQGVTMMLEDKPYEFFDSSLDGDQDDDFICVSIPHKQFIEDGEFHETRIISTSIEFEIRLKNKQITIHPDYHSSLGELGNKREQLIFLNIVLSDQRFKNLIEELRELEKENNFWFDFKKLDNDIRLLVVTGETKDPEEIQAYHLFNNFEVLDQWIENGCPLDESQIKNR